MLEESFMSRVEDLEAKLEAAAKALEVAIDTIAVLRPQLWTTHMRKTLAYLNDALSEIKQHLPAKPKANK